ncbi:hypothetical protein C8J57DRAFT_522793 [Mycena rebaudengoi]|nr:hypothetical protein C8J57DRAFT_522793 [Mycena rebaudengoi]
MPSILKLCVVLSAAAVLVAAVEIEAPPMPTSGGTTTIKWTPDASLSRPFSIELHHESFNDNLALANNINPESGEVTVPIPSVPPTDGYTIEFVGIDNINEVFGTSPEFSIAPAVSTSEAPTSISTATPTAANSAASGAASNNGASSVASFTGSIASSASGSAASARASGAAVRTSPPGVFLIGLLAGAWVF